MGEMRSWPTVEIHPISGTFPDLVLGESEEIFGDSVKLYVCGITPYDSTHLGHAATYLTFDLVTRFLKLAGKKVSFVENITDIDDPLFERARRDNVDWERLAEGQIALFTTDMTQLRVVPPDFFIPVTTTMSLLERAISQLAAKGFTYTVDEDIYFSIEKFLTRLPLPLERALEIFAERGGDPHRVGKKHPLDSLLWMKAREGEPSYESVHGKGRPGWHIECVIISLRYLLGENYLSPNTTDFLIDVQGGGTDLIFPHHFMSAIQAEALTGIPFSRTYLHVGMIGLDGEKMSKSKGNLVFVSKLLEQGVEPATIRLALMDHHYRTELMWNDSFLPRYSSMLSDLKAILASNLTAPAQPVIQLIINALANDLNTPRVIELLSTWISNSKKSPSRDDAGVMARALDSLLGIAL